MKLSFFLKNLSMFKSSQTLLSSVSQVSHEKHGDSHYREETLHT